jgi:hypothetical protein
LRAQQIMIEFANRLDRLLPSVPERWSATAYPGNPFAAHAELMRAARTGHRRQQHRVTFAAQATGAGSIDGFLEICMAARALDETPDLTIVQSAVPTAQFVVAVCLAVIG